VKNGFFFSYVFAADSERKKEKKVTPLGIAAASNKTHRICLTLSPSVIVYDFCLHPVSPSLIFFLHLLIAPCEPSSRIFKFAEVCSGCERAKSE
jgi:hypothetical protein